MIKNKLYSINELEVICKNKRKKNYSIGLTNGCFDLLHPGHLHLIKNSSLMCNYLIVAVNSDLSIKSIKGENRPIQSEEIRINNLSKIPNIDAIVLFEDDTPINIIPKIMPNIIFKGSDYKEKDVVGYDFVRKNSGKVVLIDLLEGFSTTNIINKSSI